MGLITKAFCAARLPGILSRTGLINLETVVGRGVECALFSVWLGESGPLIR